MVVKEVYSKKIYGMQLKLVLYQPFVSLTGEKLYIFIFLRITSIHENHYMS
jgi:hypothetical protein